jgi:hypothetical protein
VHPEQTRKNTDQGHKGPKLGNRSRSVPAIPEVTECLDMTTTNNPPFSKPCIASGTSPEAYIDLKKKLTFGRNSGCPRLRADAGT